MQTWDFVSQPVFLLSVIGVLVVGEIVLLSLFLRTSSKIRTLLHRQNTLFKGKGAKDLEAVIVQQAEDLAAMDKDIHELFEISNRIHRLAFSGVHKVGVLRFNPFKEVGSNQSFSIALLDGKNSGAIISSIHTREGSRVYAKPILNGDSEAFPLTEEEKQAILLAQKSQKKVLAPPTQ
jgi:hypothetical protein